MIAGAVVLSGCAGTQPAAGAKVDPALLTLVPADTSLMAGLRAEALEKTPVYQQVLSNLRLAQIDDFMNATGLKARKDLWELLFVSNGRQSVVIGRGKFADEAEPELRRKGAERFGYKGFNLVGDERSAVALISPSTAAMGETVALKWLLDQHEKSNGPSSAMMALLKDISPDAQIWAAYGGGGLVLPLEGNLANANRVLGSLNSGTAYFDFRNGLNGLASGLCSNDQTAQDVQGALQALLSLGRLSAPANQPDIGKLFDNIRVTRDSRVVKVSVEEPQELVQQFLGLGAGLAR
jgi:hypothetical protein